MSNSYNKDPFEVLGVARGASDEEVKRAYRAQVKKYHPDNYDSENPLSELAKEKMQEVNWAYDEIQRMRAEERQAYTGKGTYYQNGGANTYGSANYGGASSGTGSYNTTTDPFYIDIRNDVNARRFADAERKLLTVAPPSRVAEWHYLMCLVLVSRKNMGDAMRELEIACNMDPSNFEYQKAKEMFNTNAGGYQNTYYGSANGNAAYRRSDVDRACDCCSNLICLDCLCECLGGDLIACC
jgi:hypothetical protein